MHEVRFLFITVLLLPPKSASGPFPVGGSKIGNDTHAIRSCPLFFFDHDLECQVNVHIFDANDRGKRFASGFKWIP